MRNELQATELIYKEVLKQLDLSKRNLTRKQKLSGDIVTKRNLEEAELDLSITKSKMLDIQSEIKSINSKGRKWRRIKCRRNG